MMKKIVLTALVMNSGIILAAASKDLGPAKALLIQEITKDFSKENAILQENAVSCHKKYGFPCPLFGSRSFIERLKKKVLEAENIDELNEIKRKMTFIGILLERYHNQHHIAPDLRTDPNLAPEDFYRYLDRALDMDVSQTTPGLFWREWIINPSRIDIGGPISKKPALPSASGYEIYRLKMR